MIDKSINSVDEFLNLVYPNEALSSSWGLLKDYYVEQYGKRYQELIERRLEKTIYLFDSNPKYTYQYLLENEDYVFDSQQIEIVSEYVGDLKARESIRKDMADRRLYSIFCQYHNISETIYKAKYEEILLFIKGQKEFGSDYKETCFKLGIRPINSQTVFYDFLCKTDCLQQEAVAFILKDSLWLNDIRKSLAMQQIILSPDLLAELFNGKHGAVCCNIPQYRIVKIPLIELYYDGMSIDQTFFHENRHAIEASEVLTSTIGLDEKSINLKIFNEIRTDLHAYLDESNLPVIFSRSADPDVESVYKNLFRLSKKIFSQYGSFLDQCAIENDFDKLFKAFGKKELLEYNRLLENTFKEIMLFYKTDNPELFIDSIKHLEVEEQLIRNASYNGYKAYQKI